MISKYQKGKTFPRITLQKPGEVFSYLTTPLEDWDMGVDVANSLNAPIKDSKSGYNVCGLEHSIKPISFQMVKLANKYGVISSYKKRS